MATLGEPVVGTAVYGPVRTVVWEDGGREAPSYPILVMGPNTVRINRRSVQLNNKRVAW